MSNNKNISEETRTTERGEPGQRPRQQSNKTRPKNDIKNKVNMAAKVGPKPGQLGKGEKTKPAVEVSHTVYHDMGMLMAESLGLVSEEINQMEPVTPYKKPGALKKRAAAARKAGKKPANSVRRSPDSIDYPRGGRP